MASLTPARISQAVTGQTGQAVKDPADPILRTGVAGPRADSDGGGASVLGEGARVLGEKAGVAATAC